MIYKASEVIQIFGAGERTNGRTDEGVPRGPRGPKNPTRWALIAMVNMNNNDPLAVLEI